MRGFTCNLKLPLLLWYCCFCSRSRCFAAWMPRMLTHGSLLPSQADTTPGSFGGLASWLRTSAHLTRPGEEPVQPPSPASGDESPSPGKGGRSVSAVLDFNAVEARSATPTAAAADAEPAPTPKLAPAAKPPAADAAKQAQTAKQAVPAPAVAPQPESQPVSQLAKVEIAQPAKAAAAPTPAALAVAPTAAEHQGLGPARSSRASVLRAVLLLCLLAGLLLAGPLALHAYAPAMAQRNLPGKLRGSVIALVVLRDELLSTTYVSSRPSGDWCPVCEISLCTPNPTTQAR